jgi:hypothetical protein
MLVFRPQTPVAQLADVLDLGRGIKTPDDSRSGMKAENGALGEAMGISHEIRYGPSADHENTEQVAVSDKLK